MGKPAEPGPYLPQSLAAGAAANLGGELVSSRIRSGMLVVTGGFDSRRGRPSLATVAKLVNAVGLEPTIPSRICGFKPRRWQYRVDSTASLSRLQLLSVHCCG